MREDRISGKAERVKMATNHDIPWQSFFSISSSSQEKMHSSESMDDNLEELVEKFSEE